MFDISAAVDAYWEQYWEDCYCYPDEDEEKEEDDDRDEDDSNTSSVF